MKYILLLLCCIILVSCLPERPTRECLDKVAKNICNNYKYKEGIVNYASPPGSYQAYCYTDWRNVEVEKKLKINKSDYRDCMEN